MQIDRNARALTVTVAASANVSEVFELNGCAGVLIKVPASTGLEENSKVRLEVAHTKTATDFAAVTGLTDITPGSAAVWANPDLDGYTFPAMYGRLHLVDSNGADVNQTAARTFTLMLKG